MTTKATSANQRWTDAEERLLRRFKNEGRTLSSMAITLCRSESAITQRLKKRKWWRDYLILRHGFATIARILAERDEEEKRKKKELKKKGFFETFLDFLT